MAERGGIAGGLSTGVKIAAVGLLIHQLMKHAQQALSQPQSQPQTQPQTQPQSQPGGQPAESGGGLGDILGGLLGGAGVGGLLGGLGHWLDGLRQQGLGRQVDSWVSPGGNEPVAPQDLRHTFDARELEDVARRHGTTPEALLAAIGEMAPRLVDRMTPEGRMPDRGDQLDLRDALREMVEDETPARPGRPA